MKSLLGIETFLDQAGYTADKRSKFMKSLLGIETHPSVRMSNGALFQIHEIPIRDWNT